MTHDDVADGVAARRAARARAERVAPLRHSGSSSPSARPEHHDEHAGGDDQGAADRRRERDALAEQHPGEQGSDHRREEPEDRAVLHADPRHALDPHGVGDGGADQPQDGGRDEVAAGERRPDGEDLPQGERQDDDGVERALHGHDGGALQLGRQALDQQLEEGVQHAGGEADGDADRPRTWRRRPSSDGTMITPSPPSATPSERYTTRSVGVLSRRGASSATQTGCMKRKKVATATPVVADGEEVAEQRAGVERAHEQELGPEVAPEEHAERPPAREHQGQDDRGDDETQHEQHAGRGVRPADQRPAEPDEDEAAGDQAVAGQVASGLARGWTCSSAHPSGSSSGSPRAYSTTRMPAATISAPPAIVQPLGRWPSKTSA